MDVESHKSFVYLHTASCSKKKLNTLTIAYYSVAMSTQTVGSYSPIQKKSFFILHLSLADHIPSSLAHLLAFSHPWDATEYYLEIGPRTSEIPT